MKSKFEATLPRFRSKTWLEIGFDFVSVVSVSLPIICRFCFGRRSEMSPEFLFRFEWPEASVSVDSLKRYLSFPGIRIGRLYRWNRIGISVETETEADIVHHRNRRSLSLRQNISLMSQTETRFESPPISWNTFIPKMTLSIRNVWNLLQMMS